MSEGSDVVSELIRMARDVVALSDAEARKLEERIRERWGGAELGYIGRRSRNPEAVKAAVADARSSGRVSEAASRHGVSRQTLYRLLKK